MISFWMETDRFSIYCAETYDRFFLYSSWRNFANDMCTASGPIGYEANSVIGFGNIKFDGSLLNGGYKIPKGFKI